MVENLVDLAICSLLKTIPGLQVVPGLSDDNPSLELPAAVVYSEVVGREGRKAIYELKTTVEYETVAGTSISSIQSVMTAIDTLLTEQPSNDVMAQVTTAGLSYLGWEGVPSANQEVGERRKNVRQLQVFASLA